MADLSQKQLEEMVVGKQPKAQAIFYEKAMLDVSASKEAGRRIYRPTVFIKLIQPGIVDNISYAAQQADIDEYPDEYQYFQSTRQGQQTAVAIDIIPGLNISHKQELIDLGLSTIERLANTKSVPTHLEYARISAITLNQVLQEQAHGRQEENTIQNNGGAEEVVYAPKTETLHEAHRRHDTGSVGRREAPTSRSRREDAPAERVQESGRDDRREGLISNDWSISFG